jgi:hypothetical protein
VINGITIRYLLVITALLAAPAAANESDQRYATFTVEGLRLSMAPAEAEAVLQSSGFLHQGKQWVLKEGKFTAANVALKSRNGILTSILVTRATPKTDQFDFEKEARSVETAFSADKLQCSITEKSANCSFGSDKLRPVYQLSISFTPRKKKYTLQYRPDALAAREQTRAQREASGVMCFVEADPASFEEVFHCMGSYRHVGGIGGDINQFESNIGTSNCNAIWRRYRGALQAAGLSSEEEIEKHRPDCRIFARAVEEMTGKPAYWSGCLDYRGTTREHAEKCLTTFIPGYYGQGAGSAQTLRNITDCGKLTSDYALGVRAAAGNGVLPADFTPLDCKLGNELIVAWGGRDEGQVSACQGYSPDHVAEHLEHCLDLDTRQLVFLNDCRGVRQKYEARLKQTYGKLPPNYSMLRCSDTEALLARAEEARQEMMARRKAEMERLEKIRAQQAAAANKEWNEQLRKSEKIFKGWDIGRGPIVDPDRIDALESRTGDVDFGPIRNYQQPALLLALASGDFSPIQSRRAAALVYINAFHNAFVNSEDPSCLLASDPGTKQVLEDAIMTELGMNQLLSPNAGDAAAVGLGVMLQMFNELETQGAAPTIQRGRNMEYIRDQGFYDAVRLAQQADGCNADSARTLFTNAVKFVGDKSQLN